MIKRIVRVRSFGVFRDFRWPAALPEFKKYNLIYGWNYSGKTTLSRVFRCIEEHACHEDYPGADAALAMDDGSTVDLISLGQTLEVRVFNSDYVRENLSFDEASASPILVLGAADIATQKALDLRRSEKKAVASAKEASEKELTEVRTAIEKGLTTCARDSIKNPLAVPSYDRTRFEPRVNLCKDSPAAHILDEEQLRQDLAAYQSRDRKPVLSSKAAQLASVSRLRDSTAELLRRSVTASQPIARLLEEPAAEKWVSEGRALHEGRNECRFCGQTLPPRLLDELAEHFSNEYERLMADLQQLDTRIAAAQLETVALDHKAELYPELAEQFEREAKTLEARLRERSSALTSLREALNLKKTSAFAELDCPQVVDPGPGIAAPVDQVNKTIAAHNERTADFEARRQEAFARLERHYAASFVVAEKYPEKLRRIDELGAAITAQEHEVKKLDQEIRELEEKSSEASRGAERVNELLAAYFGRDDLRVTVTDGSQFQLLRGGALAKNLSEGERTAIAFAFFITQLQDGRHPVGELIVVVDDPVSSLDSNHVFNTYALIKTQLRDCRQLFIATHSFDFYNLLRDWAADEEGSGYQKRTQDTWKRWSIYITRRTDDATAVIEEIPRELLRFRSEYHYLFAMLHHFDKEGAAGFDAVLSLPNAVRRFMEAFGGIMIPLSAGLSRKMERLFDDEVERERVWKFINHYSHNTSVTRSLAIPDMSECQVVVRACLNAVRKWDARYYGDLESEVT